MKTTTILPALALGLGLLSPELEAAIVITNLSFTENSVRFDVAGTFPDTPPLSDPHAFYFVNPDIAANPGFAFGPFDVLAPSVSSTGSPPVRFAAIGHPFAGDFFVVTFQYYFSGGESISGTITAIWDEVVFDPTQVTNLNVYWGSSYFYSPDYDPTTQPPAIIGGVYLASVAIVPEPSAIALLISTAAGVFTVLHKRKAGRS